MTEIDYQFSLSCYDVWDGVTLPYFVAHKFNVAQLIVPDTGIYKAELDKIKSYGIQKIIVDVEQPIWAGGQQKNTPISNFGDYFAALKSIGVTRISSEGGRDGDLDYINQYFPKGFVNYNCDQCGLWKGFYKHPATVMNSWESYYTWEWPSIQQGVKESAPLGIKNGILAGIWGGSENPILSDTLNGSANVTYYKEADWIDANGGLDHFAAWGGLNPYMLGRYKSLGFETIVANLQARFPPRGTAPPVLGNPIAFLYAQYDNRDTTQTKVIGRAWDKDGNPATGRMTGLWYRDQTTKLWYGAAFVPVDSTGYYEYSMTKLIPVGYHECQIQTNDGVTTKITPYSR